MKLFLVALGLCVLSLTVTAQTLSIQSNVPVKVEISQTSGNKVGHIFDGFNSQIKLAPGQYRILLTFPDLTTQTRSVLLRKNCTLRLDLTYIPTTKCPVCSEPPPIKEIPKSQVPEEPIEIPEIEARRFDKCCNCTRDNLKARLDLFAIELQRYPRTIGSITAPSEEALDYLVNQRKIDRHRLVLRVLKTTRCVELWVVQ